MPPWNEYKVIEVGRDSRGALMALVRKNRALEFLFPNPWQALVFHLALNTKPAEA